MVVVVRKLSPQLICTLLSLVLLPPGGAVASELSSRQAIIIDSNIAKLKYPQERALASQWSDAKKVAEFICRPLAIRTLKRQIRGADRVFLGTDEPGTLRLVGDRLLEGSGQVRTGSSWQSFTFSCTLDPQSGKAVSFATNRAAQSSNGRWRHYFGPGPVRSPTFNPPDWPGSK